MLNLVLKNCFIVMLELKFTLKQFAWLIITVPGPTCLSYKTLSSHSALCKRKIYFSVIKLLSSSKKHENNLTFTVKFNA